MDSLNESIILNLHTILIFISSEHSHFQTHPIHLIIPSSLFLIQELGDWWSRGAELCWDRQNRICHKGWGMVGGVNMGAGLLGQLQPPFLLCVFGCIRVCMGWLTKKPRVSSPWILLFPLGPMPMPSHIASIKGTLIPRSRSWMGGWLRWLCSSQRGCPSQLPCQIHRQPRSPHLVLEGLHHVSQELQDVPRASGNHCLHPTLSQAEWNWFLALI